MSVNTVTWKVADKTFRSLCRRWVNPAIVDEAEARLQGRLFEFLFALPPLTVATTLLAAAEGSKPDSALAALSISLPVLASSWLSLSGSTKVRKLIAALAGALLVLSTAASNSALIAACSMAVAFGLVGLRQRFADWKIWQVSSSAAMLLASALLMVNPAGSDTYSLVSVLPVALLAAVCIARQMEPDQVAISAIAPLRSIDSQLLDLAFHSGSILAFADKRGFVIKSSGRSSVECLAAEAIEGNGLIEKMHVGDRAGFLAWLGGLITEEPAELFKARLSSTTKNGTTEWYSGTFKRIDKSTDGALLSLVMDNSGNGANDSLNAVSIGSLGHELRTPLNAILAFSELLADGFCGPLASEKQAEYVRLILQSSRHLLQVSDAMLDWAQIESGNRQLSTETFLPADAASLAISMLSADARSKSISLEFNPACGLEEFRGDRSAVTQILVNLLSNAIKFAPLDSQVQLTIDIENECLVLSVSDNGPGFTSTDQAMVGGPFVQGGQKNQNSAAGYGLGLSIVRQLTRLHNGSMQIESEPGHGACVKVALPMLRIQRLKTTEQRSAKQDETTRIIQLAGEMGHAKNRKTA